MPRKEPETDVTAMRHTLRVPDETVDEVPDEVTPPVTCAICGRRAPELPATWSSQVSERGRTYLCDGCTRANLRSIEGKLDEAWW